MTKITTKVDNVLKKVTDYTYDNNGKITFITQKAILQNVNMDISEWNNIKPNGTLGESPSQPLIGYQTPGKGAK